MRKKVRGLRASERLVLERRQGAGPQVQGRHGLGEQGAGASAAAGAAGQQRHPRVKKQEAVTRAKATQPTRPTQPGDSEQAGQVVLDYGAAVRGILTDDQGGPLHPPGIRLAEARAEVQASLGRRLALNKPGRAPVLLGRLAACSDRGLAAVRQQHEQLREQVKAIQEVAATLDGNTGTLARRKARYKQLQRHYESRGGDFYAHLGKLMRSFAAGLFVPVQGKKGQSLPTDNLDLERWFRKPKGHERRIHGHKPTGVRIVVEGPTLLLALDAHEGHPQPFTADDLLPYRHAVPPPDQVKAMQRHKLMRQARSPKNVLFFSQS